MLRKSRFFPIFASLVAVTVLVSGCAGKEPAKNGQSAEPARPLNSYFPVDAETHWAADTVYSMLQSHTISGYVENDTVTVRPDNPITRAEFVTILVQALDLQNGTGSKSFADVKETAWYAKPVQIASSLGLVSGETFTEFAPELNISRAEIATITANAFAKTVSFSGTPRQFTDISSHWAKPYIDKVSQVGIVSGYENNAFQPDANATRAEAMVMLQNALKLEKTSLPADSVLTDLVLNAEQEKYEALHSGQYDSMNQVNDKYYTGFSKSQNQSAVNFMQELAADDFQVETTRKGQLQAQVVWKSDRLAAVRLNGALYDTVTKQYGKVVDTYTEDDSDVIYLQKTPDLQWKIYGAQMLPLRQRQ